MAAVGIGTFRNVSLAGCLFQKLYDLFLDHLMVFVSVSSIGSLRWHEFRFSKRSL